MKPQIPLLLLALSLQGLAKELPSSINVSPGTVNAITITRGENLLAINSSGGTACDTLLLTHARRDIVRTARASQATHYLAGEQSLNIINGANAFWESWWEDRFNYYQQQVTQLPTRSIDGILPLPKSSFNWEGLSVEILPTPGYTRDAVTYLIEIEDQKVAFIGDLMLEGGKVRDLYSFQNEIRDAKIGGYHGYLGRLSTWLESLEALRKEAPDFLVPSRGPISANPDQDLERAMEQARAIYANYLSTNALHWYFGEARMNTCAELVLGENHGVQAMPFAELIDLPDWCRHIGTTKLLVSSSGRGFALDVGGKRALETLLQIEADGLISSLDGIFATHTHNDHTAAIEEASQHFACPVYALPEVADVLKHPERWFLPGVSPNRVTNVTTVIDRQTFRWEEFSLTFFFYPGQMYNHGALLVEKEGHDPVFFIGDSFSPSGIDDYCLMNRNLMREDTGYALCFRLIEELPENTWLVNQHIPHLFRFSKKERDFLTAQYQQRTNLIAEFVAWDDVNYAIDEQWASFYPYAQTVVPGKLAEAEVRLWNHSTTTRTFTVHLESDAGAMPAGKSVIIPARETASIPFQIELSGKTGLHVITATIGRDDGVESLAFCETLLRVSPVSSSE